MRFFYRSYDGGPDSGVTGYWLVEIKWLFSVVLLRFSPGTRDAFHNHAFHAITWWIKGSVVEEHLNGEKMDWKPSFVPKWTPRTTFHKIIAGSKGAWALSFRGPWDATWKEHKNGETYKLKQGRERVA